MPENLNLAPGMECDDRGTAHCIDHNMEVWFTEIAARMATLFASTPYVVGAMAWFHDRSVLRALTRCRGVGFVVTSERGCGRYHQARFGALPRFHPDQRSAVKVVGRATGRRRALMHHKFAVGLDAEKVPLWVLTGSYNPTEHSRGSLENALLARAPALAAVYYREYQRVFHISRHVVCRAPPSRSCATKAPARKKRKTGPPTASPHAAARA